MSDFRAPASTAPLVLVVDDEPANRDLLAELLEDEGIRVVEAEDGLQALQRVAEEPPDAILLDVMMPHMDGYQVCNRLKSSRRTFFIPVIMVTALSDVASKVMGLEVGADDFINKPVRRSELMVRLKSLLRIRGLRDELDTIEDIILAMVDALEGKDPHTRDHSHKVAAVCAEAGRSLGLSAHDTETLVWGAILHDVGKMGVPESVLRTPPEERSEAQAAAYRSHTEKGARILEPLGTLRDVIPIIRHHHERADGSGFPAGLSGDAIPPLAQVVGAANHWGDLLQTGLSFADAADELRGEAVQGRFVMRVAEAVASAAESLAGATIPDIADLLPPPVYVPGGRVLVADDLAPNREMYASLLGSAGFSVLFAATGAEALSEIGKQDPDLLLLDLNLPDLQGDEVCRRVKADLRFTHLPVLMITAQADQGARLAALRDGADEFLTLPVNRHELIARVRSLMRLKAYHLDLERHESVILSLAETLEAKDAYTKGHSSRVGEVAVTLAEAMGLELDFLSAMRTAGLLHDIGKVGVSEAILNKPGPLTRDEFQNVMIHPDLGFTMCRRLNSVHSVLPFIRFHHERFDGKGYPLGLKGEEIPLGARILAVADAFDALTSHRAYRPAMEVQEAIRLLLEETSQGKWDPAVIDALQKVEVARFEEILRPHLRGDDAGGAPA